MLKEARRQAKNLGVADLCIFQDSSFPTFPLINRARVGNSSRAVLSPPRQNGSGIFLSPSAMAKTRLPDNAQIVWEMLARTIVAIPRASTQLSNQSFTFAMGHSVPYDHLFSY